MSAQILMMIVLDHVTLSLTTSPTLIPTLLLMLPLSLWKENIYWIVKVWYE